MTPITAASAMTVVTPEISISQRTLATMRAAAGSTGAASFADGWLMISTQRPSERLVVAAEEAGERLDRVLAHRVTELSRSRHKALILAGRGAIDGAPIRAPRHPVQAGPRLLLHMPPAPGAAIPPRPHPLHG